jgi:hypothetical protein
VTNYTSTVRIFLGPATVLAVRIFAGPATALLAVRIFAGQLQLYWLLEYLQGSYSFIGC